MNDRQRRQQAHTFLAGNRPGTYTCQSCGRDDLTIYDMFGWLVYELVVCRACVREGMEGR